MSTSECSGVRSELLESAADVCARQWTAVGGLGRALGERACGAIVDPEALVLMSLVVRELDPRLDERLAWWARVGARQTSVQRMRTLVEAFPENVGDAWRSFAGIAASHGRASWRAHADPAPAQMVHERPHAEHDEPSLAADATLVLRLRAGFGVNAKADLLAFLVGNAGRSFSAAAIAHELAYSETTTKRAARDMARAGLVQQIDGHPAIYSVDSGSWTRLLELESAPPWRPWALLFPFVAHALAWAAQPAQSAQPAQTEQPAQSAYLRASRARDLFERTRSDFQRYGIPVPKPERHPGEAFEGAFLELLRRLAAWMSEAA